MMLNRESSLLNRGPVVQGPYYTLTWHTVMSDQWWPDASGQQSTLLEWDRTRPIVFQSCPISSLTLWDTCQHDPRVRSSQGPHSVNQVETQWLSVLTGRVRSRQRLRPVKGKRLKRLQNATRLEPSCFQLNFGLHLSYLVLSLTNVHHT
jgi:hypothetical protein